MMATVEDVRNKAEAIKNDLEKLEELLEKVADTEDNKLYNHTEAAEERVAHCVVQLEGLLRFYYPTEEWLW